MSEWETGAGIGLGSERKTGARWWSKDLVVQLRNSAFILRMSMEMMERKLVPSQCDIIRSCHSFNPGFSLAQRGLVVTQEFSPAVIGWETERQPGGRRERMRLWQRVTQSFFLAWGMMTTLLSSKGQLNLLIKYLLGDLTICLFVESVDQKSNSSSLWCICFCPSLYLHIFEFPSQF